MELKPLGDKVVIKHLDEKAITSTGILLPTNAQDKSQQAEVVAVGSGVSSDGKVITMEVAIGDNVIYAEYTGTKVKLDSVEYIIVKQSDILAIVK